MRVVAWIVGAGLAVFATVAVVIWYRLDEPKTVPTENAGLVNSQPVSPPAYSRPAPAKPAVASRTTVRFLDITSSLGLNFVSFSGTTPEKHFPTANGSGVALIDFDADGWLDIYLLNCSRLDDTRMAPPNAMWRSRAGATLEDISQLSGADFSGFTQGVTAGDFNNDGFDDLYLVRYGPDIVLVNNGDGTFHDMTDSSGADDPRWGTSAAFLDFDNDGSLDLYVATYGQWDEQWHKDHWCGTPPVRIYCSPKILAAEVHRLYRSFGDGRFEDVAESLGIARRDGSDRPGGRGQGVVTADLNDDGHIDIYVANDLTPNFLFINTGNASFEDHTETSCAAYNSEGQAEAGMGVDACDIDGDGLPELFVTNFYLEHNTLYQNLGKNLFNDVSQWSGVAAGSIHFVGWGTAFEDFDHDGLADILVVNGHVDDNLDKLARQEPYEQPPGFWHNAGKGRFEKIETGLGAFFETPRVSRGAAFGDIDNDGSVDVVATHKDQPATIVRSELPGGDGGANRRWIQLRLVGTQSSRNAIGARVECQAGGQRIHRQVKGGRSYLSAHDMRLTIGLGSAERCERVVIRWPSGITQELADLELNTLHTVREPVP